MATQSIENKILSAINRKKHGVILFASDFADLGERKAINKAFERIALSGKIIRLARGIYCKPKVDTEFGFGIVYPSVDDVAKAIHTSSAECGLFHGRYIPKNKDL